MSEMVERVARALWAKRLYDRPFDPVADSFDWDHNVEDKDELIDQADAAISAMREPTEDMWRQGLGSLGEGGNSIEVWQDMIDAALRL